MLDQIRHRTFEKMVTPPGPLQCALRTLFQSRCDTRSIPPPDKASDKLRVITSFGLETGPHSPWRAVPALRHLLRAALSARKLPSSTVNAHLRSEGASPTGSDLSATGGTTNPSPADGTPPARSWVPSARQESRSNLVGRSLPAPCGHGGLHDNSSGGAVDGTRVGPSNPHWNDILFPAHHRGGLKGGVASGRTNYSRRSRATCSSTVEIRCSANASWASSIALYAGISSLTLSTATLCGLRFPSASAYFKKCGSTLF